MHELNSEKAKDDIFMCMLAITYKLQDEGQRALEQLQKSVPKNTSY